MPLYTFVMEYLGGTYIEQVRARSVRQACVKWAEKLDAKSVKGLGPVGCGELLEKMREEPSTLAAESSGRSANRSLPPPASSLPVWPAFPFTLFRPFRFTLNEEMPQASSSVTFSCW
jgi:hypothetical protein